MFSVKGCSFYNYSMFCLFSQCLRSQSQLIWRRVRWRGKGPMRSCLLQSVPSLWTRNKPLSNPQRFAVLHLPSVFSSFLSCAFSNWIMHIPGRSDETVSQLWYGSINNSCMSLTSRCHLHVLQLQDSSFQSCFKYLPLQQHLLLLKLLLELGIYYIYIFHVNEFFYKYDWKIEFDELKYIM